MPKKAENLIGKTYGELTVVEKIPDDTHRRRYDRWICKCSCGEMVRACLKKRGSCAKSTK